MPTRAGTLVCAIGIAAIGLAAQSPTPSEDQPPRFRSGTRLVRVTVVVHDLAFGEVGSVTIPATRARAIAGRR